MSDKPQTHRRAVRSFVKRAGRLTSSQQRALDELWPARGIDYAPEPLDLDAVFGRAAPRVLEIGFGNGDSLVETAAGSPETDYLGVEVHEPGVGHCLLGIEAAAITNVRLIMHDAIEVLENQLAPGSPGIGKWFRRANGTTFEVVAVDESAGTIEIQQFDGTVDEIDVESWFEWLTIEVSAPEDWSGSVDMDPEDFVSSNNDELPPGFHDPLDYLDRL